MRSQSKEHIDSLSKPLQNKSKKKLSTNQSFSIHKDYSFDLDISKPTPSVHRSPSKRGKNGSVVPLTKKRSTSRRSQERLVNKSFQNDHFLENKENIPCNQQKPSTRAININNKESFISQTKRNKISPLSRPSIDFSTFLSVADIELKKSDLDAYSLADPKKLDCENESDTNSIDTTRIFKKLNEYIRPQAETRDSNGFRKRVEVKKEQKRHGDSSILQSGENARDHKNGLRDVGTAKFLEESFRTSQEDPTMQNSGIVTEKESKNGSFVDSCSIRTGLQRNRSYSIAFSTRNTTESFSHNESIHGDSTSKEKYSPASSNLKKEKTPNPYLSGSNSQKESLPSHKQLNSGHDSYKKIQRDSSQYKLMSSFLDENDKIREEKCIGSIISEISLETISSRPNNSNGFKKVGKPQDVTNNGNSEVQEENNSLLLQIKEMIRCRKSDEDRIKQLTTQLEAKESAEVQFKLAKERLELKVQELQEQLLNERNKSNLEISKLIESINKRDTEIKKLTEKNALMEKNYEDEKRRISMGKEIEERIVNEYEKRIQSLKQEIEGFEKMKQEYSLIESQIAELENMQNMLITENENLKRKLLVNTSGQSGIAENKKQELTLLTMDNLNETTKRLQHLDILSWRLSQVIQRMLKGEEPELQFFFNHNQGSTKSALSAPQDLKCLVREHTEAIIKIENTLANCLDKICDFYAIKYGIECGKQS